MLSLSPAKLLVVLVIALIVLGPEKLPQVARQLGAFWGDVRRWRERLESEVRNTFPDLPPTHEVVQAVRSPLSFLDRLADAHEGSHSNGNDAAGQDGETSVEKRSDEEASAVNGHGPPLPHDAQGAQGAQGAKDPPAAAVESSDAKTDTQVAASDSPLGSRGLARVAQARASSWRPPPPPADESAWGGHDDPNMN